MVLTVNEVKAKPNGGYTIGFPVRSAQPLNLKQPGTGLGGTIVRQVPLKLGRRQTGQLTGKRVSTAKPIRGPLGTKSWTIM